MNYSKYQASILWRFDLYFHSMISSMNVSCFVMRDVNMQELNLNLVFGVRSIDFIMDVAKLRSQFCVMVITIINIQ
ncbi:hypothetical protein VNO78_34779 [Psophocarpus tetragonolobus]|uniref:Uncharacterized protein n=1 Tax=Psophocarpus tetragonolobus TaxID=3891 RepID=A0AAN9NV00_PSOTE